jgi:hypothetical protein
VEKKTDSLCCPNCRSVANTEKTVHLSDSTLIKCPKCQHQAGIGDFRKASFFSQLTQTVKNAPSPDSDAPSPGPSTPSPDSHAPSPESNSPDLIDEPSPQFPPLPNVSSRIDRLVGLRQRSSKNRAIAFFLAFFDFSFNRYLTPLIIKLTWIAAIALALLSLTLQFAQEAYDSPLSVMSYVSDLLPDEPAKSTPRKRRPASEPLISEEVQEELSSGAVSVVLGVMRIIVMTIMLMWLRVMLEGLMVVFQVASDVKAIRTQHILASRHATSNG